MIIILKQKLPISIFRPKLTTEITTANNSFRGKWLSGFSLNDKIASIVCFILMLLFTMEKDPL